LSPFKPVAELSPFEAVEVLSPLEAAVDLVSSIFNCDVEFATSEARLDVSTSPSSKKKENGRTYNVKKNVIPTENQ
jgi:hypothetical protein